MASSYAHPIVTYNDIFKMITWLNPPTTVVEIGILNGYSLRSFAESCPSTTQIYGYDIFEKFNGNSASRDIIDKFIEYPNVHIAEGDFYELYKTYPNKSIDLLHIDIANDGSVYEFALEHYMSKLTDRGVLILEGGSQERDAVAWMKKYNKVPIYDTLIKYKSIYNIHTITAFPSITFISNLKV
jgi:predicted O-methyltransferase YrrM